VFLSGIFNWLRQLRILTPRVIERTAQVILRRSNRILEATMETNHHAHLTYR
jgi:hypothetical protein